MPEGLTTPPPFVPQAHLVWQLQRQRSEALSEPPALDLPPVPERDEEDPFAIAFDLTPPPTFDGPKRRRPHRITVDFPSERELDEVKAAAAAMEIPMSEFVRRASRKAVEDLSAP